MSPRKQWTVLILVILVLDLVAMHVSKVTGDVVSSEERPFTVSEVYDLSLLGDYVYVRGEVKEVLEDHMSEKGFTYQDFILTDGEESIKLFCSTKYGRAEVKEGEEILFDGEFQKYYNTYEIYGFCSEIRK